MSSSDALTTPATPSNRIGMTEGETEATLMFRTTKRKLDDAFQSLDNAVGTPEIERPPPSKRTHTIRSLYSTLAKYGIKRKETQQEPSQAPEEPSDIYKNAPHLTAILSRAATRTRKAFGLSSQTPAPQLPPTADYRPSSLPAFLARLSTFKLSTYANKPSVIDAVAASKCGWTNDGKDRLVCANALLEKQRASLVDAHKDGCPWKTRQCDPTIYCIPLQAPATMVKDIKTNALALDSWLKKIEIKHPLTSTQVASLQSTFALVTPDTPASDIPRPSSDSNDPSPIQDDGDVFMSNPQDSVSPSNTAILVSLFGWSLAPATPPDQMRRASLTRASSLAPSVPRTPSLSRASSVRPTSPAPQSSPLGKPPATPSRAPSAQFTFRVPSNVSAKRDTILHCVLCQRRIGLWAFTPESSTEPVASLQPSSNDATTGPGSESILATPLKRSNVQRSFDVLKEHRAYCPYVVRSTVVPTPPVPPALAAASNASSTSLTRTNSVTSMNGQITAVEGWRALLTVILRYGAGQKQRLGLDFVERLRGDTSTDDSMEVDGVKAMIAGVKKRGGRDLLQYVKGLLG
ncbi:hypothetical protein H0H92_013841 [Tricholoma furcatifolium]|nr:hypothetical protein H0H92_013841 [Tricholoma furcatifolium]